MKDPKLGNVKPAAGLEDYMIAIEEMLEIVRSWQEKAPENPEHKTRADMEARVTSVMEKLAQVLEGEHEQDAAVSVAGLVVGFCYTYEYDFARMIRLISDSYLRTNEIMKAQELAKEKG